MAFTSFLPQAVRWGAFAAMGAALLATSDVQTPVEVLTLDEPLPTTALESGEVATYRITFEGDPDDVANAEMWITLRFDQTGYSPGEPVDVPWVVTTLDGASPEGREPTWAGDLVTDAIALNDAGRAELVLELRRAETRQASTTTIHADLQLTGGRDADEFGEGPLPWTVTVEVVAPPVADDIVDDTGRDPWDDAVPDSPDSPDSPDDSAPDRQDDEAPNPWEGLDPWPEP